MSKTLLVYDQTTMDDSYETIRFITFKKINVIFVPKGLTSLLQPIDVCINRSFKEYIRHEYENAVLIFNGPNFPRVKR